MKVVLYARSSVEGQCGRDFLSDQVRQLTDYARKQGYEVVETFEEIGAFGQDADLPVLDDMVEFAVNPTHEIEGVLVATLSRLCRNAMELQVLKNRLDKSGVRIMSTAQETVDRYEEPLEHGTLAIGNGSV
jgi:DNA invertase Pin-like site-specific DNA recombinase